MQPSPDSSDASSSTFCPGLRCSQPPVRKGRQGVGELTEEAEPVFRPGQGRMGEQGWSPRLLQEELWVA